MFVYLDFYISNINLFFTSSLTKLNFYKAFFCLIGSHYGLVCSLCCISFSDSETTEDEATEPQIPLEGKKGPEVFKMRPNVCLQVNIPSIFFASYTAQF